MLKAKKEKAASFGLKFNPVILLVFVILIYYNFAT